MVNKHHRIVRERSGRAGATDRRVERTQQALTFALVELVLTKRWAKITVQDLLDRAGVGRSTFYAHYRSKEDLLLKSFVQMLDLMDACLDHDGAGGGAGGGRVAAVAELFQHVGEVTAFHRALARAHVLERLFLAGSQHMSRHIERRLATLAGEEDDARGPQASGAGASWLAVAAQAHAGSLFALLRWWIDQAAPHTPEEMDRMFHALVRGGLRGR